MTRFALTDSIAGDFLRVALADDQGKLRNTPIIAEALRGAFLIDFVRVGILDPGGDGAAMSIDTSPTGSPSADDLLGEVQEHPDRTLECWMRRGVPHLHEVIAELIADGAWRVERAGIGASHVHYADVEHDRFVELGRTLVGIAAGRTAPVDERQAALAVLAEITGLTAQRSRNPVSNDLLHACGHLESIATDVAGYQHAAQEDDLAAGTLDLSTQAFQIGSI